MHFAKYVRCSKFFYVLPAMVNKDDYKIAHPNSKGLVIQTMS